MMRRVSEEEVAGELLVRLSWWGEEFGLGEGVFGVAEVGEADADEALTLLRSQEAAVAERRGARGGEEADARGARTVAGRGGGVSAGGRGGRCVAPSPHHTRDMRMASS